MAVLASSAAAVVATTAAAALSVLFGLDAAAFA